MDICTVYVHLLRVQYLSAPFFLVHEPTKMMILFFLSRTEGEISDDDILSIVPPQRRHLAILSGVKGLIDHNLVLKTTFDHYPSPNTTFGLCPPPKTTFDNHPPPKTIFDDFSAE